MENECDGDPDFISDQDIAELDAEERKCPCEIFLDDPMTKAYGASECLPLIQRTCPIHRGCPCDVCQNPKMAGARKCLWT